MQRFVNTPDEYLEVVPEAQLPLLQHLRSLIFSAAPHVREEIQYGMLVHVDDAGVLFGLAAQKHFVALYVAVREAMTDMEEELKSLDHGKGCVRFRRLESVPRKMIARLLATSVALRSSDGERASC